MTVIECCQQFLLSHHENAFSNPTRNQHCAGRLNSLLGFPKSRALFEYYDIILSRNMILGKHGDKKAITGPDITIASYTLSTAK